MIGESLRMNMDVEVGLGDSWSFGTLSMGEQRGKKETFRLVQGAVSLPHEPGCLQGPPSDSPSVSPSFLRTSCVSVTFFQPQQDSRDVAYPDKKLLLRSREEGRP